MLGEIHAKQEAPPLSSQPPNVALGYDKFIEDILSPLHQTDNKGGDVYQGMIANGEGHSKSASRLQKFLKWSGIAFAVAIGATIVKKAVTEFWKSGEADLKQDVKKAATSAGKVVAKHL
jgi:multimeric flavodoxin WrbA